MKKAREYRPGTIVNMMMVVAVFLFFFNSNAMMKWIRDMGDQTGIKATLLQIYEPVYAVCTFVPYTRLGHEIGEGYREFAGLGYREIFDGDPSRGLSPDDYPWLKAMLAKPDKVLAASVDSQATLPKEEEISFAPGTVLQILLIGDSMLNVGLGDVLKKKFKELGDVEVTYFGKNSTGLVRQDYFDWFKKLEELCKGKKYHLIVLMIGANDGQGIRINGKDISYGSDAWREVYRGKVNAFASMMSSNSVRFYWLGMPAMLSPFFDKKMKNLTKVFEEETARFKNGKFIPTIDILSNGAGKYAEYVNFGGKKVYARGRDGIHFAPGGGEIIAKTVIDQFKKDFKR